MGQGGAIRYRKVRVDHAKSRGEKVEYDVDNLIKDISVKGATC